MELKERMTHTAVVFHEFLPAHFPTSVDLILRFVSAIEKRGLFNQGLQYMFLPEFIAIYGLDDLKTSIQAMERITQLTSCEFAVRPFILKYDQQMLDQMLLWSTHSDTKVRRFASEGSRPRLPWAMALPKLKNDPTPLLSILDNLKNDHSEFVRRSVANNLNDIAKDNPEVTYRLAKKWLGFSKERDALVKHGCRTLLKAGDVKTLQLFGLGSDHIRLLDFKVSTPLISMGNRLKFSFKYTLDSKKEQVVRMEYAIHHLKKSGEHTKKVFKISERMISANGVIQMNRHHHFKPISTRVYYSGLHRVSIILNGKEFDSIDFVLVV